MLRPWLASIAVLLTIATTAAADEVDTPFGSWGYDRWLFSPKTGQSGGKWKTADDGLHAIIPRGSDKRTPMWFVAEAKLEGDFEIVAAYDARALPKPRERPGMPDYAVSNGVELGFRVGQTWVSVFDTRRPSGEAVGYFIRPPDGKNAYAQVPGSRPLGRLAARRVGSTLTLLHGEPSGDLVELGKFEIGTEPAEEVALDPQADQHDRGHRGRLPAPRPQGRPRGPAQAAAEGLDALDRRGDRAGGASVARQSSAGAGGRRAARRSRGWRMAAGSR